MPLRHFRVQIGHLDGKETELVFFAEDAKIKDGCLVLEAPLTPNGPSVMALAFAPGAWRGFWVADSAGNCLVPSTMSTMATQSAAPAAPSAEDRREEKLRKILQSLERLPYESLDEFSKTAGCDPQDAEWAISSALARGEIPIEKVADESIQRTLDRLMPDIIRRHKPKTLSEMKENLSAHPETATIDFVQLRVWVLCNQKNRRSGRDSSD